MVYPIIQDFLSCFSPITFDLSCFIRSNLYYPNGHRFCTYTILYLHLVLSWLITNYLGHLSAT